MNDVEKQTDLISVIIPVYKVEQYINRCVDSVINQTFKNLEIILVDDGSIDNSGKICDEYAKKDKRIIVIHKKNGGLSSARNAGINIAHGKFLSFIDGDDYVDKRFIEILYKNIKENDADVSIVNYYQFSNTSEVFETQEKEKVCLFSQDEFFENMYDEPVYSVVAWNKLYKKEIFDDIKYPVGKINEDEAVLHYIVGKCSKIVTSNLELYYYFQRTNSIMHSNNKQDILDVMDFLYDRINYLKKINKKNTKCYYGTMDAYAYNLIEKYSYSKNNKKIKKYFYILRQLLKENNFKSKKQKYKFYLLAYFPKNYLFLRKLKKNNFFHKIKNEILDINMKKMFKKYLKQQRKNDKKLYLIFNTPNHGNLGDQAIAYAELKLMNDLKKEPFYIMSNNVDYFLAELSKFVNADDKIYIHGGGYFGTLWKNEIIRVNRILEQFHNNEIVVFPQTVYYSQDISGIYLLKKDKEFYSKFKNLTILCRDRKSYEFCNDNFNDITIKLTPDIVTYLNEFADNSKMAEREGIGFCFRNDKEKILKDDIRENIIDKIKTYYPNEPLYFFDTVMNVNRLDYKRGKKEVIKLLKKISCKKLIITDRLHGLIFSVITDTPCIALGNVSGKVKGAFEWINMENNYVKYVENIEEIDDAIKSLNINEKNKYKNEKLKEILVKNFNT